VRDVEALVKRETTTETKDTKERADPNTRAAEDKLRLALGTRVRINRRRKGGRIEIEFVSEDELQRIYERLIGE
jgi:ParB family chromosome partitioning protein